MTITCQRCGFILATRSNNTITVKGQEVPTEHLDGVILRCDSCQRTKTYFLKKAQKLVKSGFEIKPPDIVAI